MDPRTAPADETSETHEIARVNTFPDVGPDGEVEPEEEPVAAGPPAEERGGWSLQALGLGVLALAIIILTLVLILQGVFQMMPS